MKLDWDSLIPHLIHDLRALARKGITNAQLLERKLGPEIDPECLSLSLSVIDSQRDLGALLQRFGQLTDAAKSGSFTPAIPIDLPSAMLAVKIQVRPDLEKADAQLIVEGPLPARGFKGIQTVLQELIQNSIRYRDLGRPLLIHVRGNESSKYVCIEVADNGAGWNPTFAGKLFEPLERLDVRRGGAGLGLAIAKAYVEAAGGSIHATLLDPGASFVVELPLNAHPE